MKRRRAEEESNRWKLEEQAKAERGEKEERMRARVRDLVHQNELLQQQIVAQVKETEALANSHGALGDPTANDPQPPITNNSRVSAPPDQSVAQEIAQADVTSFLQPPMGRGPGREEEGRGQRLVQPNQQMSFAQHQSQQRSHSMMAERA